MAGRAQLAEQQPTYERHLALVDTGNHEYDKSFMGEGGLEVKILFQGKDVVRNRKRVFREMAARASNEVKPEEET